MNFIFIILILPAFGVLISADVVHAAVGGGVPCLVMVPSVPSVSVCCWFRHLVFIASGVPADIVGVWSMAALVLVLGFHSRRLGIGCACACLSGLAGSTRGGWRCLLSAGWILCLGVLCGYGAGGIRN